MQYLLRKAFPVILVVSLQFGGAQMAAADGDARVVDIAPGDTVDVYFEINMTGRLYLNIRQKDGWGCAELWWIVWPLGSIKGVGEKCGLVQLDVPGISSLAVSSKLRASAGATPLKIGVSASESVASHITFSFP